MMRIPYKGTDISIVKMEMGLVNSVKNLDSRIYLTGKRESGDEFGGDEWVSVKIGFVDNSVDLVQLCRVSAFPKF